MGTATTSAQIPERTTNRREVAALSLGEMAGEHVVIDGSRVRFTAQSYMDGLVKAVLDDGGAASLVIDGLPEYARDMAIVSADYRNVRDKLTLT